jgi:type I restriction enzyme M protein
MDCKMQSRLATFAASTLTVLPLTITSKLKATPEQKLVVGPLVYELTKIGWKLEQIIFGKKEWLVPKRPSEATKREKNYQFDGFPVDIAVFDSQETAGDPHHVLFVIECKHETESAGVSQVESYFVGEPHVQLGVWANSAKLSSEAAFLYRKPDGRILFKKRRVGDLPRPGEAIKPDSLAISYNDLITPDATVLKRTIQDILDKAVANDPAVTRREQQLDQLCNLLLLKLESDREARTNQTRPVFFAPWSRTPRRAWLFEIVTLNSSSSIPECLHLPKTRPYD